MRNVPSAALALVFISWMANQYPLWGTNELVGPAHFWGMAYMFLAAVVLAAAVILAVLRHEDWALGCAIVAAGFYANSFMMEIAKDRVQGGEASTLYSAIQALMAMMLVLGFILTRRATASADGQAD